jgi:hypothetical protein
VVTTPFSSSACIIDGEVTAFDPLGLLDFHALHFHTAADDDIAVWAFNLLFHDGRVMRELPLIERKDLLMVLIMGAGDSRLRLSDSFDDGVELLAAAEKMGSKVWSRNAAMRLPIRNRVWLGEGEDPGLARGEQGAVAAVRAPMKSKGARVATLEELRRLAPWWWVCCRNADCISRPWH